MSVSSERHYRWLEDPWNNATVCKIYICTLFTHVAPRSSQELVQKCPCIPGSNWNLEMLVSEERGKPEYPETNLSEQTNNRHMTPGPGIEPGLHWWEASTLTTAPSLLPLMMNLAKVTKFTILHEDCWRNYTIGQTFQIWWTFTKPFHKISQANRHFTCEWNGFVERHHEFDI